MEDGEGRGERPTLTRAFDSIAYADGLAVFEFLVVVFADAVVVVVG